MKVEELRIGSFVKLSMASPYYDTLLDKPLIVSSINECESIEKGVWTHSIGLEHLNTKKNVYYERYSQFIENIAPIEINDDWLNLFKYEFYTEYDCFDKKNIHTDWSIAKINDGYRFFNCNKDRRIINLEFKYVHEFQNIYFILHGEDALYKL